MNDTMIHFLESKKFLDPRQMGFRKGKSTIDGCLGLVDEINKAWNNNSFLLAVFVDLAKVFNTVNHNILLKKMSNIGFCGKLLSILQSYLDKRIQMTKLTTYKQHCPL